MNGWSLQAHSLSVFCVQPIQGACISLPQADQHSCAAAGCALHSSVVAELVSVLPIGGSLRAAQGACLHKAVSMLISCAFNNGLLHSVRAAVVHCASTQAVNLPCSLQHLYCNAGKESPHHGGCLLQLWWGACH